MRRLCLLVVFTLAATWPAHAHRLKVFATVEGGSVVGYGFFIGGGRPQGAVVIMRDPAGKDLWRGETDSDGRFSWHPGKPMSVTVIVDARDGHVARTTIDAERFAGAAPAAQAAALLEAYDQASDDIRLKDIIGGVGMIAGLAGIGMWALSRRQKSSADKS